MSTPFTLVWLWGFLGQWQWWYVSSEPQENLLACVFSSGSAATPGRTHQAGLLEGERLRGDEPGIAAEGVLDQPEPTRLWTSSGSIRHGQVTLRFIVVCKSPGFEVVCCCSSGHRRPVEVRGWGSSWVSVSRRVACCVVCPRSSPCKMNTLCVHLGLLLLTTVWAAFCSCHRLPQTYYSTYYLTVLEFRSPKNTFFYFFEIWMGESFQNHRVLGFCSVLLLKSSSLNVSLSYCTWL